jgi:hypothetical protein
MKTFIAHIAVPLNEVLNPSELNEMFSLAHAERCTPENFIIDAIREYVAVRRRAKHAALVTAADSAQPLPEDARREAALVA